MSTHDFQVLNLLSKCKWSVVLNIRDKVTDESIFCVCVVCIDTRLGLGTHISVLNEKGISVTSHVINNLYYNW